MRRFFIAIIFVAASLSFPFSEMSLAVQGLGSPKKTVDSPKINKSALPPADALFPANKPAASAARVTPLLPVASPPKKKPVMAPAPKVVEVPDDSPKTVHVKGYYRKDGTYVEPHDRAAPKKKMK